MLASITPLGERGRHRSYPVTMIAFVLGASAGRGRRWARCSAPLGSLVAGGSVGRRLAWGCSRPGSPWRWPWICGPARPRVRAARSTNAGWTATAAGSTGSATAPSSALGLATVVSSAATYAAAAGRGAERGAGAGALILGVYGAARGLTPLLAAGVRRPEQLMAWHARFEARRRPALVAGRVVLLALTATALSGAIG